MDELFTQMQKLIANKLEIEESRITLDSSFRPDLGADSLDTVELVMALEENFSIEIPDEDASGLKTVGDAVRYVEAKKG